MEVFFVDLKEKVALITGGTSGIGQAVARLFVKHGASVAFTGRRSDRGLQLAHEIGGLFVLADHRNLVDCESCIDTVLGHFGHIDILFNNAGIVLTGTAETTKEDEWQEILDINVTAVWRMSRLVIPIMRRQGGGVIVNNASDWGIVGAQNAFAYCMSKGAVIQMTKAMALDYARQNIRVNAICPGDTFVERWLQEGYFRGSGAVEESVARMGDDLPLGRVAEAAEIARAVLFLSSDESSFMTGAALVVDGGNTAR
jgi:NAD(P)-dependent dehydrogenase (short-subunit alcohol dehydrogenase family)